MNERQQSWLLGAAFGALVGGMVGFAVGGPAVVAQSDFGSVRASPPTTIENHAQIVELPEMDVELRIVHPLKIVSQVPEAYAYSEPYRSGACRVYFPSRQQVFLNPRTGTARWVDDAAAQAMAHELMHCALGYWHPAWGSMTERRP